MRSGSSPTRRVAVLPLLACQLLAAGCSGDRAPTAAPSSPYAAVSRGWITVEGGVRTVRAPYDGRISEVRAKDGDAVEAGQILLLMDEAPLAVRLATARARLDQASAQVDRLRARLPVAERDAVDLAEAADAGAQPAAVADRARSEVLALRAEIRAATASVEIARQGVSAAQLAFNARLVRSPVAGRVLRSLVHAGDHVLAQSAGGLLQILPAGPRIVRAELAEEDLAVVHVGSEAEVSAVSGTGSGYPARVIRIAGMLGPTMPEEDAADPLDSRAAECVLAAKQLPFLVGQRVIVRFRR